MIRTVARVLGWNSSPRSKPARLPSELRAPRRLRISRNRFLPVALLVTLLLLASSTRFRQPAATTTKKPGSVLGRLPLAHLFGSTRANLGVNITFAAYLDQHFPQHTRLPTRRQPTRLWLTVSDETWVDSGTAALQVFVDNLNEERRAKFGGSSAKTALVVLCVDAECIEKCVERGMYCYGGFMYSRPKKVLAAVWPKVAGLIEALKARRDVFFVDSDVFFRSDPYISMEPLFPLYDLIASENDVDSHINTGFFWIRSCRAAVHAWQEVLALNLHDTSRDQINFNEILGTATLRQWRDPKRRPLKSDFLTESGLRVHVLDPNLFRASHFDLTRPLTDRHEAVFLHMTCGDDMSTRVFLAQSEGFWGNVNVHYSAPPKLLSLPSMTGGRTSLEQLLGIAFAASHYTARHFLPPATALVRESTGKRTSSPVLGNTLLPIYRTFPIARLAHDLSVPMVEPNYVRHATHYLTGSSLVRKLSIIHALNSESDLDIRTVTGLIDLVEKLKSSSFAHAHTIRIVNAELQPRSWENWTLPATADSVKMCHRLDAAPRCTQLCRESNGTTVSRILVSEPWVTFRDLLGGWDRGRPRGWTGSD